MLSDWARAAYMHTCLGGEVETFRQLASCYYYYYYYLNTAGVVSTWITVVLVVIIASVAADLQRLPAALPV